jgi:hypothetical protein
MAEQADPARLDFVLLPVLDRHGGGLTRGDLFRLNEIEQITREEIAAWTESAEDRGLISSQGEPGGTRRYSLTEAGESALSD